ncbi:MAG: branched-chain amino acid ABC transporter substrate-binding protein [Desulfatirhabdiaceae bacterium]
MSCKQMISFALVLIVTIISGLTGCETPKSVFRCTDRLGCIDITSKDPIKIGVIQALSGNVAPLGLEQIRGIGLALDKWQGKYPERPIVIQTEDSGCTEEGGANAALKIIADPQIAAILGTTCSSAAASVSKAMSDAGLVMISGNNSAPFLTSINGKRAPNWHPGYFRTAANEETSGKTAALYAFHKLGIRKAATIHDGDIYTRGLTDGFAATFLQLGGDIVLAASINKGDNQMQPVLKAVLNSRAEFLFFPLFQPEGNHILEEARQTPGFEHIILMSDGALIESSFIEDVKELGKGMYFVGPSSPDGPDVHALAAAYQAKYHVLPSTNYYLRAYDAACLLLETIWNTAIQETDGTLHIGRQALRDALYATRDFKGVTGSLTCDEFGDCSLPVFNVLRLDDPSAGIAGLLSNVMFTYRHNNLTDQADGDN